MASIKQTETFLKQFDPLDPRVAVKVEIKKNSNSYKKKNNGLAVTLI